MIPNPLFPSWAAEAGDVANAFLSGGWGWVGLGASDTHHHGAPFAFLIMLQMCLMAERSLCTERGAPAGIREACLCEPW